MMIGLDTSDDLSFAFGLFNLLLLASYFPQVVAVARDDRGAYAISLTNLTVWVGANATIALYAWARLADSALVSISAFNTACCLLVFCIAAYKRHVFTRSRIVRPLAAA